MTNATVIYASVLPGGSQVLNEGRVPLTGRVDEEVDRQKMFERKPRRCILPCREEGIG